MIQAQAQRLMAQFGDAGATWASCVQAAKTNWVAQFMVKWSEKTATLKAKSGG
jgi:hypothetical protein